MIGFEILNLEHRLDRKYCLLGNLITQGVPYEKYHLSQSDLRSRLSRREIRL